MPLLVVRLAVSNQSGDISIGGIAFFVVLINAIGALPAVLTDFSTSWLDTTAWYFPPAIAFPIAWTLLFSLMGVALYLVVRHGFGRYAVRRAVGAFSVQMALNLAWTPLFFGLQRPGAAFIVIVGLWVAIGVTVLAFAAVDRRAALLLLPYLVWVTYAAVLNAIIVV